jgi:hypothetical protein
MADYVKPDARSKDNDRAKEKDKNKQKDKDKGSSSKKHSDKDGDNGDDREKKKKKDKKSRDYPCMCICCCKNKTGTPNATCHYCANGRHQVWWVAFSLPWGFVWKVVADCGVGNNGAGVGGVPTYGGWRLE